MSSHTLHEWNTSQAPCLVTRAYIPQDWEKYKQKEYKDILSVIYKDTYNHLTLKKALLQNKWKYADGTCF